MLHELFGPSKEEIWKKLSKELEADFQEGSFWQGKTDRVDASFKSWIITLDTFYQSSGNAQMPFTRMRAPFINKDGFRFKIFNENFFTNIGKLFGMQDIVVGYPEFDNKFIIQGNNLDKVKALFDSETIRNLLTKVDKVQFEIKDDEGFFNRKKYQKDGADLLYFVSVGVIKDLETLRVLYALFAAVLEQLCQMDSAYETDPGIEL